jgi:uncharacterized protein (TIGR03000 family)
MRSLFFPAILAAGILTVAGETSPRARADKPDGAKTGRPAIIEMTVPADAQIGFDGDETSQRGTLRLFRSPPLEPEHQYHYYNVRVRWTANGQKFDETICICVREGDHIKITYPRGFVPETPATVPPARANTYYFGPDSSGRTITYYSDYGPPPNVKTFSELSPMKDAGPPGFRYPQ